MVLKEGYIHGKFPEEAVVGTVVLAELAKTSFTTLQRTEERIRENGPITFDEYMEVWLDSYYSKAVIGNNDGRILQKNYDFMTPPEHTPVFGFCMTKQILQLWEIMGKPANFKVVEMGAGNGTLAHDILHGIKYYQQTGQCEEGATESIEYVIVEKNEVLLSKQRERLKDFSGKVEFFHESAASLPLKDVTGVFISTELPDAFPVHLVRKIDGKWEELYVDIGDENEFEKKWGEPVAEVESFIEEFNPKAEERKVYPVNIAAVKWMEKIGKSLKNGYVLTVDYDYDPNSDMNIETIAAGRQAVAGIETKDGCFSKRNFGNTDLTTGVDFQILANAGKINGLKTLGYVNLSGFLFGLCADIEVSNLLKDFPDNKIGDRVHDFNRSGQFYEGGAEHWNVLIQSGNIEEQSKLPYGLMFVFNESEDCYTRQETRDGFRRIKV